MNEQEAITLAREWISARREVRKHLLAAARRAHPKPGTLTEEYAHSEIRKLWRWPSDLSEQRLLALIDHPAEDEDGAPLTGMEGDRGGPELSDPAARAHFGGRVA